MKRKTKYLSAGALAAVLLLSGLGLGGMIGGNGSADSAIAAALKDPLSILSWRSPGERREGALFQIKQAPTARARPAPHERVLSQARERPAPEAVEEPGAGFGPEGDGLPVIPLAETTGPSDGPPVIFQPTAPPPDVLPPQPNTPNTPGTPDGPNPPPDNPPPDNPPPPPPGEPPVGVVPEPATWAMLILGFFGVAGAMRVSGRRHAAVTATSKA